MPWALSPEVTMLLNWKFVAIDVSVATMPWALSPEVTMEPRLTRRDVTANIP